MMSWVLKAFHPLKCACLKAFIVPKVSTFVKEICCIIHVHTVLAESAENTPVSKCQKPGILFYKFLRNIFCNKVYKDINFQAVISRKISQKPKNFKPILKPS